MEAIINILKASKSIWIPYKIANIPMTENLRKLFSKAEKFVKEQSRSLMYILICDSELFTPIRLKTPISRDPDDDKFIAVALAANCHLSVTRYKDIEIINPIFRAKNDFR